MCTPTNVEFLEQHGKSKVFRMSFICLLALPAIVSWNRKISRKLFSYWIQYFQDWKYPLNLALVRIGTWMRRSSNEQGHLSVYDLMVPQVVWFSPSTCNVVLLILNTSLGRNLSDITGYRPLFMDTLYRKAYWNIRLPSRPRKPMHAIGEVLVFKLVYDIFLNRWIKMNRQAASIRNPIPARYI